MQWPFREILFPLPFALPLLVTAGQARADEMRPAEPTIARLVYDRGELAACPDEQTLKNTVRARLGYDPFDVGANQTVIARIGRERGSLRGQVELRDRFSELRGSRVLRTDKEDCAELASAMALAISIAIDPLCVERAAPTAPVELSPSPQSTSSPTAPAPPPSERATAPELTDHAGGAGVGVRVGATAGAAFGATPGASFAPSVFAGLAYRSFSIDIEARGHFESSTEAPRGGVVNATLLLASAAPCFHLGVALGCAIGGLGRLAGTGTGVDVPESDTSLYANAGARLGAEIPVLRPLSVRIAGDVLFPLVATTLRLRGSDVWSTPPVTVAIGAGVLARFP